MSSDEDTDVFSAALALPRDERARLAHDLLASLSEGEDPDAATYWVAEIERRAQEVKEGTAEFEDWEVVRARLEGRWGK
ncbi:MAG: addiction module protein [Myxococcales bacterium]